MELLLLAMFVVFLVVPSLRCFMLMLASMLVVSNTSAASVNVKRKRIDMMTNAQLGGYSSNERLFRLRSQPYAPVGEIEVLTVDDAQNLVQFYRYTGNIRPVERRGRREYSPYGEGRLMYFHCDRQFKNHVFMFVNGIFGHGKVIGNLDVFNLKEGVRAIYKVEPMEEQNFGQRRDLERFYSNGVENRKIVDMTIEEVRVLYTQKKLKILHAAFEIGKFRPDPRRAPLYDGYVHSQRLTTGGHMFQNSKIYRVRGENQVYDTAPFQFHKRDPNFHIPPYTSEIIQAVVTKTYDDSIPDRGRGGTLI